MKTVGEARIWLKENLKNTFSAEELPEIVFLTLNHIAGFTSAQLHAFPEKELSEAQILMLLLSAKKLQTGLPVQYVLGETNFFRLKFKVNNSVLIPRPETEELVSWVLELQGANFGGAELKAENPNLEPRTSNLITILDIGTGSGCIPIAIKKNWPEAAVSALDISAEALQTAKENALLNQADVHFFLQDILNFYPVNEASKYDIIISNPPYITPAEKQLMEANVLDFEPHQALFVPQNDPLLFYRAIASHAVLMLQKKGFLFLEINENFGKETVALLQQSGFENVELRKDFNGKDRMIRAQKT